MNDFDAIKKVYFIGIGGIGVSAIAKMFILEEKEVYGSDTNSSEIIDELIKSGANIFIGQDILNIPKDTDLIIYTIAIEKAAPDFFSEVKEKFSNVISYPEALSVISKNKYTIAICGTHGKTTTTAMISKILIDAGLDPTVIVGSLMSETKSNFVAGRSKYLVVEACEYCRSFLQINPTVIGITSIDDDHMDYYKDSADIISAFKEFVLKVPESGIVVGDQCIPEIKEASSVAESNIIDSSEFYIPDIALRVPGEHNKRNASVALAISDYLGIDKNKALKSLENFSGTWRRFEFKGKTEKGALVYDDYAHHPKEIEATLNGAREMYPDKKITIVFQPHLYSRTKIFLDGFAETLSKADKVIVTDIYAAREDPDQSISGKILLEKIQSKNQFSFYLSNFKSIEEKIIKESKEGDLILIMGAGDVSNLSNIITEQRHL